MSPGSKNILFLISVELLENPSCFCFPSSSSLAVISRSKYISNLCCYKWCPLGAIRVQSFKRVMMNRKIEPYMFQCCIKLFLNQSQPNVKKETNRQIHSRKLRSNLFQLDLKLNSNMLLYWLFSQHFFSWSCSFQKSFFSTCVLKCECDSKWGHFTRNQQNFFALLTGSWWWFEDGKCDWQMVGEEPFSLPVFTLLSDCERLSARLIDTNVPQQDIFLHWWLFLAIPVSSVLLHPWFSFIGRLFVSPPTPIPLSIFWVTVI